MPRDMPLAMVLSSARRVTVCLVAAACLLLTANLRMRSQHAATAAVLQEQRWRALSERLDRAALATPILTSPPPPAAAPSPTPSSPALSSSLLSLLLLLLLLLLSLLLSLLLALWPLIDPRERNSDFADAHIE